MKEIDWGYVCIGVFVAGMSLACAIPDFDPDDEPCPDGECMPGPTESPPEQVTRDCGVLGYYGACEGSRLLYCQDDELVDDDCSQQDFSCGLVNDQWGFDCVKTAGQICAIQDLVVPCGQESACLLGSDNQFRCSAGRLTCSPSEVNTCRGDVVVWSCDTGHVTGIDCASFGERCEAGECVPDDGGCVGEECNPGPDPDPDPDPDPGPFQPGWPWGQLIDPAYTAVDADAASRGDIAVRTDGSIVLGAATDGEVTIGPFSVRSVGGRENPFVVSFSSRGVPTGLLPIQGDAGQPSYIVELDSGPRGSVWMVGTSLGALALGAQYDSGGYAAMFAARLDAGLGIEAEYFEAAPNGGAHIRGRDIASIGEGAVINAAKQGPATTDYLSQSAAAFLVRVGPTFDYVWHGEVVFGADEWNRVDAVGTDAQGNTYWGGKLASSNRILTDDWHTPEGAGDVFVVKLDPAGQVVWTYLSGGSGESELVDLEVDSGGNVYGAVQYRGEFVADRGSNLLTQVATVGGAVLKLSPGGSPQWLWTIPEADGSRLQDLSVAATGHLCVTGRYSASSSTTLGTTGLPGGTVGAGRGFVARVDYSGSVLDAGALAGEGPSTGVAVEPSSDGGCVVYGYLGGDQGLRAGSYLMKYLP